MLFISLIILLTILKVFKPSPDVCQLLNKRVVFAHRGGNTDIYHENTMDIFISSVNQGLPVEIDILKIKSGEIICYHDLNFEKKTGVNQDVESSEWKLVQNLTYLDTYDSKTYNLTASIPLLSEVVNEICRLNSTVGIWLDVKTFLNIDYAIKILEIFENSPCSCTEDQILVIEVFDQLQSILNMKIYKSHFRCKFLYAFTYYEFEAESPYQVIKSKILSYSIAADIFDFDSNIIWKYPQVVNEISDMGICSSVYGEINDVAIYEKYSNISILITDIQSIPASNGKILLDFPTQARSLLLKLYSWVYIVVYLLLF